LLHVYHAHLLETSLWTDPSIWHIPAPNYGEAQGAESRADLTHKIRIILKDLNESSIWLRIIERSHMLSAESLVDIIKENGELCRIFTSSLATIREDV